MNGTHPPQLEAGLSGQPLASEALQPQRRREPPRRNPLGRKARLPDSLLVVDCLHVDDLAAGNRDIRPGSLQEVFESLTRR